MFETGSIVTLSIDKIHGEGTDALKLKAGVCGMVARGSKKSDGNHQYVVDFGPYGQWYCTHPELSGDDKEGWDGDDEGSRLIFRDMPMRDRSPEEGTEERDEDAYGFEDDDIDDVPSPEEGPTELRLTEEEKEEMGIPIINLEKDLERRAKEIEAGIE